jgi:hypothetical protein
VILYGPPGTGKTYIAQWLVRHLAGGGDGFWELVQFHPGSKPLDTMWDDIHIRSLTFELSGDLDRAGRRFIEDLTG